jgi:RNA polymerase sigma factor (sigma-70 family)
MAQPTPTSSQQDAVVELIQRAEGGCHRSARLLFALCRAPLLRVIRRVIRQRVRTIFDSDDFLQETFREIFTHHFQDEMLNSPSRLWPYLKRIAENKVRDAHRKYLVSGRSDLRNEVPLEEVKGEALAIPSQETCPSKALILKELVEERLAVLIEQLPQMLQEIVRRLLQGKGVAQIAAELSIEPSRVYRAMQWLREKIAES